MIVLTTYVIPIGIDGTCITIGIKYSTFINGVHLLNEISMKPSILICNYTHYEVSVTLLILSHVYSVDVLDLVSNFTPHIVFVIHARIE